MNSVSFFLGANTPSGFFSLFNELYNAEDNWKLYIIKGGPGTGKSSLMKNIAREVDEKGFSTERIYCSSDPTSLDGIILPDFKVAVADGTSPHTIEPKFPGVCEYIINLGDYWDSNKLLQNQDKIKAITKENSKWHKMNIRYLKAASIVDNEIGHLTSNILDKNKADRYITRLCNSELKATEADTGAVKRRFLSAVTPSGIAVQYDSLYRLCDNIITLKDTTITVSAHLLNSINNYAEEKCIDRILCMCPMDPENKIEHIIFPNIKFGIFSSNIYHPEIKKIARNVNCKRFYYPEQYNSVKNRITFLNKAKRELITESIICLNNAKKTHDLLESYYITAMDFTNVSKIKDKIINEILNVSRET